MRGRRKLKMFLGDTKIVSSDMEFEDDAVRGIRFV